MSDTTTTKTVAGSSTFVASAAGLVDLWHFGDGGPAGVAANGEGGSGGGACVGKLAFPVTAGMTIYTWVGDGTSDIGVNNWSYTSTSNTFSPYIAAAGSGSAGNGQTGGAGGQDQSGADGGTATVVKTGGAGGNGSTTTGGGGGGGAGPGGNGTAGATGAAGGAHGTGGSAGSVGIGPGGDGGDGGLTTTNGIAGNAPGGGDGGGGSALGNRPRAAGSVGKIVILFTATAHTLPAADDAGLQLGLGLTL